MDRFLRVDRQLVILVVAATVWARVMWLICEISLFDNAESVREKTCPDLPVRGKVFGHVPNVTYSNVYQEVLNTTNGTSSNSSPWESGGVPNEWLTDAFLRRAPLYQPDDRPTGLRIAFIGDSLTRYQTTALIHYLHTGYWIDEYMQPNLLNEQSFRSSWKAYYEFTSEYFNGPTNFRCDCYRDPNRMWDAFLGENMFYRDECRGNHITFLSKFGNFPFRGHWEPHTAFNGSTTLPGAESNEASTNQTSVGGASPGGYNESEVSTPYSWSFDSWPDVVRNYVAHLDPKPDYLVLNAGLWAHHGLNEQVLAEIRAAADKVGITTIYKTTTNPQNPAIQRLQLRGHDEAGCRLLQHCFALNWTALVPPNHYWDGLHFFSYMNTRFNEQLLELLAAIRQTVTDSVA
jgi:hypothetical protein